MALGVEKKSLGYLSGRKAMSAAMRPFRTRKTVFMPSFIESVKS